MRLVHHVIVWGEKYVQDFLEICLPSLLAAGNLPALRERHPGSTLVVWSRRTDIEMIRAAGIWAQAEAVIPCDFIEIDNLITLPTESKYSLLSLIQLEAIRRSTDYDAFCVIYPDSIWSDNCLTASTQRLDEGYDAILITAPKAAREPFMAQLNQRYGAAPQKAVDIPAGVLTKLAAENLHFTYRNSFFGENSDGNIAGGLFWRVPGQGIAARTFHLTAIYIRVNTDLPGFGEPVVGSFDERYLNRIGGLIRPYVVQHSDEMYLCSIEEDREDWEPPANCRLSNASATRWAELRAGLGHRYFGSFPVRWYTTDQPDETAWQQMESQIDKEYEAIMQRLHAPDGLVELEDPDAYRMRINRRAMLRQSEKKEVWLSFELNYENTSIARGLIYKMLSSEAILNIYRWMIDHRDDNRFLMWLTKSRFTDSLRDIKKNQGARRSVSIREVARLGYVDIMGLVVRRGVVVLKRRGPQRRFGS
jgi:hypothetical protein